MGFAKHNQIGKNQRSLRTSTITPNYELFSRILVAIDGSDSSKKAFERSIYLGLKCNARLYLVHVVQCELGGDGAGTFELIDEMKVRAKEMLEQCKKEAIKNKIPIEIILKIGDPAHTIIEIAKNNNCDLIIMGNRGMSAFKELLLGTFPSRLCTMLAVQL